MVRLPLEPALEDRDADLAAQNGGDQIFDRIGPGFGSSNELDGGTHSIILAGGSGCR